MDTALKDFTELLEMMPGTELGSSDWYTVTQNDINTFATLTKDEDPYHVDPDWAKLNSPLSTTISFGFLTLSMLTYFSYQVFERAGFAHADNTQLFNLGINILAHEVIELTQLMRSFSRFLIRPPMEPLELPFLKRVGKLFWKSKHFRLLT